MNQSKRKYVVKRETMNLHDVAIQVNTEAIEKIKENNKLLQEDDGTDYTKDYLKFLWGK